MTQLSALVVEDEKPARDYLVELLTASDDIGHIAAVRSMGDARDALCQPDQVFDVAFIDIRLVDAGNDTSGVELARWIIRQPRPPAIVFATASHRHALDGFDIGAVDYLLKPFSADRLARCTARLRARGAQPTTDGPRRLVARRGDALALLDLEGLLAFEAARRLTYLHHDSGTFDVDLSLKALEGQLADRVIRVHRNWLVAMDRVCGLGRTDGDLILRFDSGLEAPVARERARDVRRRLLEGTVGLRPPRPVKTGPGRE